MSQIRLLFLLFCGCFYSLEGNTQISFTTDSFPIPQYRIKIKQLDTKPMKGFLLKIDTTQLVYAKKYYRKNDSRVFNQIDTILLCQIDQINVAKYKTVAKGIGKGMLYGSIVGVLVGITIASNVSGSGYFGEGFEQAIVLMAFTSLGFNGGMVLGSFLYPIFTHKKFTKNEHLPTCYNYILLQQYVYQKQKKESWFR